MGRKCVSHSLSGISSPIENSNATIVSISGAAAFEFDIVPMAVASKRAAIGLKDQAERYPP
ncbi:hypothetical protein RGR602_CH02905 [Rhizobium gallicum bv. gallicum R602sp]|uniref:Uncharacterized protein n=1 Tax=Rhizobium gallicum bv. gallicum R602sp TaxID=1041138 RepID=A0A0B4X6S7_9HYPH|nr:hypothetical protein RGR602_CH02905 [Rhizobium gallicum bv. gallicum R602sp]